MKRSLPLILLAGTLALGACATKPPESHLVAPQNIQVSTINKQGKRAMVTIKFYKQTGYVDYVLPGDGSNRAQNVTMANIENVCWHYKSMTAEAKLFSSRTLLVNCTKQSAKAAGHDEIRIINGGAPRPE